MNARTLAAEIVERVIDKGAFSQHALTHALNESTLSPGDRAFVTRLVYGTLTWRYPIDRALDNHLHRGLRSMPSFVRSHLRIAVFQLGWMEDDVPSFAAVNECVSGIREACGNKLGGVANAVLRKLSKDKDAIREPAIPGKKESDHIANRQSVPTWIARRLQQRRGKETELALAAFNEVTPNYVRVRRGSVEDAVQLLTEEGITPTAHPALPGAIRCEGPLGSSSMLREGAITVQDAAAQLVGHAFPADLKGPFLDACAGIGGKSRHLSDRYPDATVVSTDVNPRKLNRLRKELAESGRHFAEPWRLPETAPGLVVGHGPYQGVVLDAPCSGLGTMGRHPEVRWNRKPSDIAALAELQAEMLDAVAELVAPGGWLIYVVCTWTYEEGQSQVSKWLERHPDFILAPPCENTADPSVDWSAWVDKLGTISLWPDRHQTDGFFLARMRRILKD